MSFGVSKTESRRGRGKVFGASNSESGSDSSLSDPVYAYVSNLYLRTSILFSFLFFSFFRKRSYFLHFQVQGIKETLFPIILHPACKKF